MSDQSDVTVSENGIEGTADDNSSMHFFNGIDGSRSMLDDAQHHQAQHSQAAEIPSNPLVVTGTLLSQVSLLMSQLNVLVTNLNSSLASGTFLSAESPRPGSSMPDVSRTAAVYNEASDLRVQANTPQGRVTTPVSTIQCNSPIAPQVKQEPLPTPETSAKSSSNDAKTVLNVKHLPKLVETVSDDEAFRYLGIRSAKDVNDEDTELARAFKFFAFKSCFLKMAAGAPEASRLAALYCCLRGNALNRAAQVDVTSCSELLTYMLDWYSPTDGVVLQDTLRRNLEYTEPAKNELLSDYILRYHRYWLQAQSLPEGCDLSEPLACRFFINTLRYKTRVYTEPIRRDALQCRSLSKLFDLTKRCLSSAKLISQAEQLSDTGVMEDKKEKPKQFNPKQNNSGNLNLNRNQDHSSYPRQANRLSIDSMYRPDTEIANTDSKCFSISTSYRKNLKHTLHSRTDFVK